MKLKIGALVLLWTIVFPGLAAAQAKTRPLCDIFLNLKDAKVGKAKEIAQLQATQQWQTDQGPLYKSTPKDENPDKKDKLTDEVIFEGTFVPSSDNTVVAIFSDDGCNVLVDGAPELVNFKKGQHLPDLAQSFHELRMKWQKDRVYKVRIHYSNTIFNGAKDIDGCTLFAYNGGGVTPTIEITGARGEDRKKFVIGSLPPPLETPIKWSANLIGKQTGEAVIKYKRGKADAATVPWDGKPQELKFVNGKLNVQVETVDGSTAAPKMSLAKGVLTISGVEQGDFIFVEEPKLSCSDRIAVVKNFSWNDLQRENGNLEFHADFAGLTKEFKSNVIATIKFALDPRKDSVQAKQRETIEKAMAKKYPGMKLATLKIPSAFGVGVFPEDFDHGHLASSVKLSKEMQTLLKNHEKLMSEQIEKNMITQFRTGFNSPEDRAKWGNFTKATQASLINVLTKGSVTERPFIVYHTYEFDGFVGYTGIQLENGDPIRNIRCAFGGNPELFDCGNPTNASDWTKLPNSFDMQEFHFMVDKNRKLRLFYNGGVFDNDPNAGWPDGRTLMIQDALEELRP